MKFFKNSNSILGHLVVVSLYFTIMGEAQFPAELNRWTQLDRRSVDDLRNSTDITQRLLADAMDRGSLDEIHKYALAVIDSGDAQVVVSYLNGHSLNSKHALTKALAEKNQKQAIPDLIDLYHWMNISSQRGGAQLYMRRVEVIETIKQSLIQLTGISPEPEWTVSELLAEFRKYAIESEKVLPQDLSETEQQPPADFGAKGTPEIVSVAQRTISHLPWIIFGGVALGTVFLLLKIFKGKTAL